MRYPGGARRVGTGRRHLGFKGCAEFERLVGRIGEAGIIEPCGDVAEARIVEIMQADAQRGAGGPDAVPVAGNPGAQGPTCGIAADAAGRSMVEPVAAQ
ncbi:hypothetical protein D3C86_1884650 [compost metagenome]